MRIAWRREIMSSQENLVKRPAKLLITNDRFSLVIICLTACQCAYEQPKAKGHLTTILPPSRSI
jgi:hypothetical protein